MRIVFLLLLMFQLPAWAWPGGARAAISLSYDDALSSQLDHALPALNQHGLRATFYLQLSSPAVAGRMEEWRDAARRGHELGNHTLFHQCSGSKPDRPWVEAHRNLDTVSAAQMLDQVLLGNTLLHAIDGQVRRSFTAPCGDAHPYLAQLAPHFAAIKREGVAADGKDGKQLIAIVKEAVQRGTAVHFTFHGVGGDYLTVSREAHDELLRYLASHRQEVWTDTFLNIATWRGGWSLAWSDEFDGDRLDPRKWRAETGGHGWGNHELQFYTARRENVRVEHGHLVIEARRERYGQNDYTSARIKTAGLMEQMHGRFEARIKVPKGQGIWPAFWMLGADIATTGWPRAGEIDIMENIGKEPSTVHGTLHGPGYSGGNAFGAPSLLQGAAYADDFHVFAVEWEPKEIRWYRDGILYHKATPALVKGDWVFEHPFFILLNVAVGGDWPGKPDDSLGLPQRMLVDYVRVYRRGGMN